MANCLRQLPLPIFALLLFTSCAAPDRSDSATPIQFTMRQFEYSVPGCGDLERAPHPCVAYRVSWPEILSAPTPEASRRINATLAEALAPAPPAAGWREEALQLEQDYSDFQDAKFDNEATFFHRRIAEVVRNSSAIFSVSLVEERFAGEEPPEFRQNYLNFTPATGAPLALPALLAPGAEARLRRYTDRKSVV